MTESTCKTIMARISKYSDMEHKIKCKCCQVWRVERVIILFCYFSCNSSISVLVFNILLLLLLLFYLSNFTTIILDSSTIILLF